MGKLTLNSIANQPTKRIRHLLRIGTKRYIEAGDAMSLLALEEKAAVKALEELATKGYIERVEHLDAWRNSVRGDVLAATSFRRPIARKLADAKIKEMLERVSIVNNEYKFAYNVKEAMVYGDYCEESLSELETLNIAVVLEPKEGKRAKQDKLEDDSRERAKESFFNIISYLFYPEKELLSFLKGRTHHLMVQTLINCKEEFSASKHKTVYTTKRNKS